MGPGGDGRDGSDETAGRRAGAAHCWTSRPRGSHQKGAARINALVIDICIRPCGESSFVRCPGFAGPDQNDAGEMPYLLGSPRGLHWISTNSSSTKHMVVAIHVHALAALGRRLVVGQFRGGITRGVGRAEKAFFPLSDNSNSPCGLRLSGSMIFETSREKRQE